MITVDDKQLAEEMVEYHDDPLAFVLDCFPWSQGELADSVGPDTWQRQFLADLGEEVRKRRFDGSTAVDPIRMAVASGHGIGKTTEQAWIVCWIMSTRPGSRGTVTANIYKQLETKTWAAIKRWMKLCVTAHWFDITGSFIKAIESPDDWFCAPQTCAAENSEAFAGQHAMHATSFYVFDESSLIPEVVWDVAEGGLTDGEPMVFCFGNPTRNTGKFHRIVFGSERHRWNSRSIDSRDCALTNKSTIKEWVEDHGEDSDFVRVRVRGLPPRASELQYIDTGRIEQAQVNHPHYLEDDPLIVGLDVSGGGEAWNVFWFRRGFDARSIPPVRMPGEMARDRSLIVARAAEILRDRRPGRRVAMMFVDSAFGAAVVVRLQSMGFDNVAEVNFGGASPDPHDANMRAYMWRSTKEWLSRGALPSDDFSDGISESKIARDLLKPGYSINKKGKLVLESKESMQKRGEASPDDGDALALTFAYPVAPVEDRREEREEREVRGPHSWMA